MTSRQLLAATLAAMLIAGCGTGGGSGAPTAASDSPQASVSPATAPATASVAPTSEPVPSPTEATDQDLELVAVGDSIFFNSADDCPGCTSALELYAVAVSKATGRPVNISNLTEHNGLQLHGLLNELDRDPTRKAALKAADIIIVGIAHNDAPMNRDDDPCDGAGGDSPDWSLFTEACIAEDVTAYTPKYEQAYELIAAMREGRPTILRTINRYNDWIGWPGHDLTPEGIAATSAVVAAWNKMICGVAEAHGFVCADISTRFNGEDGTEPAGDLLAADYTHPSAKGNEAIAQGLIDLGFAPLVPAQ